MLRLKLNLMEQMNHNSMDLPKIITTRKKMKKSEKLIRSKNFKMNYPNKKNFQRNNVFIMMKINRI
jgi:hypothetical protein